MDGLSVAASVIAVIQIAQAIGSALKDSYEDVRDARADIQKLYHSVRSLESILSAFRTSSANAVESIFSTYPVDE